MSYSHRDHRALRDLGTGAVLFVGATAALIGVALAFPREALALVAVGALALLGAAFLLWADRLTETYARDLARVREGAGAPPLLRVEVASDVGFDRAGPRPPRPSPHRRVGRPDGPKDRPGRHE